MFSHLLSSRPARRARKGTLWSASLSVTIHASLGIVFIVMSNRPSATPHLSVTREIVLPKAFTSRRMRSPATVSVPAPIGSDRWLGLTLPEVDVPTGIPPLDGEAIDAGSFVRGMPAGASGLPGPTGIGIGDSNGDAPVAAQLLAEPPVWLSGPRPGYPPLLRAAGIDGQVTLEFVVDSAGRPEPASLRVIDATHQAFVPEARRAILRSHYRPGRLRGRKVRVLVRQVVTFAVR